MPKPALRMVRDGNGRPYMASVIIKPMATITVNSVTHYLNRLIYQLTYPKAGNFRSTQICTTTFCVNPTHWIYTPLDPTPPPMPDLPPEEEPWTVEEAIELLDSYLLDHPHPPLDPEHNLLVDIPPPILLEAIHQLGKGYLIP